MKVLLLDIKKSEQGKCVNKDLAGGMGTRTDVGKSFLAKVFEKVKSGNVVLPFITNAYLAAIFKNAGWEVCLIKTDGIDFKPEKADLALIPVSIVDAENELAVIKKIKETGIKIGIFGTFASAMPEYFSAVADFVVKGEVEKIAQKIARQKEIPQGEVDAGFVEDLDSLPFPDWSLFPIKKYSYSPAINKKPILTMLASRGCPYSCSYYCPYSILSGKTWRARSASNVAAEIEYLIKNFNIKAIDFRDPVFTLSREKTIELISEIKKRKLNIVWSCETRLDRLDEELLKLMREAGLRNINVGIESFDEEILKKTNRLPIAVKHQAEIINACRKLGINMAAFYILGLPDDTADSVLKTIAYAKKLNTLVAQFTVSTPYPGTAFFAKLKNENKINDYNWKNYSGYDLVYKHKNLSQEDISTLKERAFAGYYFRPSYLFKHMPKYIWQKFIWPF